MTVDFATESCRTVALAEQMADPHCKRMMRMVSDSYMALARNDSVPVPQHERGE